MPSSCTLCHCQVPKPKKRQIRIYILFPANIVTTSKALVTSSLFDLRVLLMNRFDISVLLRCGNHFGGGSIAALYHVEMFGVQVAVRSAF